MLSSLKFKNVMVVGRRYIWEYLNVVFNGVDEERRKRLGPDRTCAEWVLRNGGQVMWTDSTEYFTDYNSLPPEDKKVKLYVKEINGTDSSINYVGFPHLEGCLHIQKIILNRCLYIDDRAFPLLSPVKSTLKHLQVSDCGDVTAVGLKSLSDLHNLNTLVLFNLPNVKDKNDVLMTLRQSLSKCNITFK